MLANACREGRAERLGLGPSLFMNLYSHVTPSMQREAAERIGAALLAEMALCCVVSSLWAGLRSDVDTRRVVSVARQVSSCPKAETNGHLET